MKDLELQKRLTNAVDSALLSLDPSSAQRAQLTQHILEGKRTMKKRLSIGLVLALLLCLLTLGALAAALLSGQEIIEGHLVPMAQENEKNKPLGDEQVFTNAQLKQVLLLAEENGIQLSDRLKAALTAGQDYSAEETIMEFARDAFGGLYYTWSIQQKYWFEEAMVAIGFKEKNYLLLPGEGEYAYDQARAAALAYIRDRYGDDPADPAVWEESVQYGHSWIGDERSGPPEWVFSFLPLDNSRNEYIVRLNAQGQITSDESYGE